MNRIDAFIDFVNYKLRCFHRADRQRDQQADTYGQVGISGEPQPAVRLLDNAEDIAVEYSKSCGCTLEFIERDYQANFGRKEFKKFVVQVQAREGSRKEPGIDKKPTAPDVTFCEIVIDEYHGFVRNCGRTAIGQCIRCGLNLCEDCEKYDGGCSTEGSLWHVFEVRA